VQQVLYWCTTIPGKTDPSREDIALTQKLIKLGEDMDF
jgi:DNA repair protein RadC